MAPPPLSHFSYCCPLAWGLDSHKSRTRICCGGSHSACAGLASPCIFQTCTGEPGPLKSLRVSAPLKPLSLESHQHELSPYTARRNHPASSLAINSTRALTAIMLPSETRREHKQVELGTHHIDPRIPTFKTSRGRTRDLAINFLDWRLTIRLSRAESLSPGERMWLCDV